MSYEEFIEELKKRNSGSAEHHVVPRSVQTKSGIESDDVVRCSPQEHLFAHLLYDREMGTKTRGVLWSQFSNALGVNWNTCSYDDLEGYDYDWSNARSRISESHKGEKNYWYGKHIPEEQRELVSMHTREAMQRDEVKSKLIKYHYSIQSPEGIVYETSNMCEFCREHCINQQHMQSRGKSKGYVLLSKTPIE